MDWTIVTGTLAAAESSTIGSLREALGIGERSALPGLMIAGGMLLATTLVMRMTWRKSRRRKAAAKAQPGTPKERLETVREEALHARAPIESLMADAEELTRRCAAILDTKAARLEALIADADERLARLERAGQQDEPARKDSPEAEGLAGEGREAVSVGRRRPDPSALGRARLAQLAAERPPETPETATPTGTGGALTDATRAVICRLADEGVAAVDIAQRTGQPVGSVELVLNLRKSG